MKDKLVGCRALVAGLEILSKYDPDAELCAAHDILLIAIPQETVSEEDQKKLDDMSGWHWSSEHDCWGFFT